MSRIFDTEFYNRGLRAIQGMQYRHLKRQQVPRKDADFGDLIVSVCKKVEVVRIVHAIR